MIVSMTGFARHAIDIEGQSLVWELKSVNHRFLELRIQLPDSARSLEPEVRVALQQALGRGKVDAVLRLENAGVDEAIRFDPERAKKLVATIRAVDHLMMNAARVSALDVLNWPGVLQREAPLEIAALRQPILDGLATALSDLQAMRAGEGAALRQTLEARLTACEALGQQLRGRRTAVIEEQRERLRSRIAELDLTLDPQRLEQEVALLAQRLDVEEELDRLDGHVAAMREILDRNEPVGRRLDFLMQEFNREANTLGSKSHDLETTRAAMELKVLIEQMREQIQNIE